MSDAVSVLIEGNYVDSYLYGGLLVAWDERGRLIIASTEALASAFVDASHLSRALARAAFVDNKLLADADTKTRVSDAVLTEVRNGDRVPVHVALSDLAPQFFTIAPNAHVLDLMATYSRLFIATDDALLSVPFDSAEVGDVQRRLPHRCLSTTPRWGAVSASCADAGSWALLNEIELAAGRERRTEQIDTAISVRHSWLGSSFLSFDEYNQVDVFKALVRTKKGERRLIEGFSSADEYSDPSDIGWWLSADDELPTLEDADFVTAFTGLLVAARNGRLQAVGVSGWSGFPEPIGEVETIADIEGRVLSIADTDGGFVVETDNELRYISHNDPLTLLARETISLRAYPRSRRHRRSVTATVDGGLLVAALLGTHVLPHDERRISGW